MSEEIIVSEAEVYDSLFRVQIRRNKDHIISAYVLDEETEEVRVSSELSFPKLSYNWAQLCMGMFEAFPIYGMFAQMYHLQSAESGVAVYLDKNSTSFDEIVDLDSKVTTKTYTVEGKHLHKIYGVIASLNQHKRAEKAHLRSQLLALLAEYEAFTADLLRVAISARPEAFIGKEATINAADVISGADLQSLKATIIEDRIEQIQRDSHIEQLFLLYDRLKLARPDDKTLHEFAEICERRNVLTHANGRVNRLYRAKLAKLGIKDNAIEALGSELKITPHYMRRSIARVFQMGYFSLHIVWQHLEPENRDLSIKMLINDSHDFLRLGYTKVSQRISQFLLNKKSPATELDRAYATINLALSYFLNKATPEDERKRCVEEALSSRDWSIVDAQFSFALACLREDYSKLPQQFDACVRDGIDRDSFLTWALFTKARKQDAFKLKMQEHFGITVDSDSDEPEDLKEIELPLLSGLED